jgi:catechol 2,3-dioxygenase-like lactoylglutathione lyase family enzyme
VVRDYDEAIDFYVGTLGFSVIEDTYIPEQDKRWVVIAPPSPIGTRLLLARAVGEEQSSRTGSSLACPLLPPHHPRPGSLAPNFGYMDAPGGARSMDTIASSGRTARLYPAREYALLLQP